MKMEVNKITIGDAKKLIKEADELRGLFGCPAQNLAQQDSCWKVGSKYLIRTVTMHLTGKLKSVGEKELVLGDAAWIADSGRFSVTLKSGKFDEIEPFKNDVIVGRGSICDATEIDFDLPREQK